MSNRLDSYCASQEPICTANSYTAIFRIASKLVKGNFRGSWLCDCGSQQQTSDKKCYSDMWYIAAVECQNGKIYSNSTTAEVAETRTHLLYSTTHNGTVAVNITLFMHSQCVIT